MRVKIDPATFLENLREWQRELPNPADLPGNLSERERERFVHADRFCAIMQAQIQLATSALAEQQAKISPLEEWRTHLQECRTTLCSELLAMPTPRTSHDEGAQHNLRLSILTIDSGDRVLDGSGYTLNTLRLGALLRDKGYVPVPVEWEIFGRLPWRGGLAEVEGMLRELRRRRDEAQAELDNLLSTPLPELPVLPPRLQPSIFDSLRQTSK